MKLLYRGINYNRKPAAKLSGSSELAGKYRGATWHSCHHDAIGTNQAKGDLIYRGVKYH